MELTTPLRAAPASAPAARRLLTAAGFLLFALMLFLPATRAYRPYKGLLLGLTLLVLLARCFVTRSILLHPAVLLGTLLFSCLGLFHVILGYVNGAPGALRMSTVFVIWPWVYALLMTGIATERRLMQVGRVLIWVSIAICLYCLSYVFWAAGMLPNALYLPLDLGQRIGFYHGFVEFTVKSLSSLIFTVPFITAALLAWPADYVVSRRVLWFGLVLGFLVGLLSGRRALQLVVALGFPIALALRLQLPPVQRRAAPLRRTFLAMVGASTAAVLVLGATVGLELDAVWEMFRTGFAFSTDPVAQSRAVQFDALLAGWAANPLLGSGHGAPAPGVIRSTEMPWAYELAYLALLYHTGLVGLLVYAGGIAWIFVMSRRVIREGGPLAPLTVAILTGACTFLIANATNPYLETYDYLWVIFLPLAVVNVLLLGRPAAGTARA